MILCMDCKIGYSRSGTTYKCSKCPSAAANSLRFLGIFGIVIIGLVFLVRSNLAGALEEKNFVSVFIRILMNHF